MSIFSKFINIEDVFLVREIPIKCKASGDVLYYEDRPIKIKDSNDDDYQVAMCFRCGSIFNKDYKKEHIEFHKQLDEISRKLDL